MKPYLKIKVKRGLGCISVVEYVHSLCKGLGSASSTTLHHHINFSSLKDFFWRGQGREFEDSCVCLPALVYVCSVSIGVCGIKRGLLALELEVAASPLMLGTVSVSSVSALKYL